MSKFEEYNFRVSDHLLPVLVNGDVSGLEPKEEMLLEQFVHDVVREDDTFHWDYKVSEEPSFGICDVLDTYSMVRDVSLMIHIKQKS